MSHGIEKPIDRVFSLEGAEWHGLAEHVEVIDDATVAPLMFKIREGEIVINIDGKNVRMDGHKALVADMRHRKDEIESEGLEPFVPLNIPRSSYQKIENEEVWRATLQAIKGLGAKVTCAGTLEAARKFFVSVDIGNGEFNTCGDKFKANLNLITSHDGTLAMEAYDSTIRIVCMNTLRWSRNAAGDVGFKVYHSSGASLAMSNIGELLNAILNGRKEFRNTMEMLNGIPVTEKTATAILAGYFSETTGTTELATRSTNAVMEILDLFKRGDGNKGKTLYDLLNGATQYWTHGGGTGAKSDKATRVYKANFAKAADHKNAFCNLLVCDKARKAAVELGKKCELNIK